MEKGLSSLLAKWLSAHPVPSPACLGLVLALLAVSVLKTPAVAGVFASMTVRNPQHRSAAAYREVLTGAGCVQIEPGIPLYLFVSAAFPRRQVIPLWLQNAPAEMAKFIFRRTDRFVGARQ
ncbi:hypothetical protein [Mesorhizobium sp. M9A.F.Ca.ET.002.03.1.2]|uniref:hypothetical protein n=1 Tax=Mesorhizobium sp. M9A.F.Ca.ET.002.03.1.2 TaxID=2493668 RepID=UPI0016779FB3|nr:hypothetical protein [Mesorhizobium sp. M9A.F.Ca.ET.002.03.1.2]